MKDGVISLAMMRHGVSEANRLCQLLAEEELHTELKELIKTTPFSPRAREIALKLRERYRWDKHDSETPLSYGQEREIKLIGNRLQDFFLYHFGRPNVVVVSPYLRARQTYNFLLRGCPLLGDCDVCVDEQTREQDHGSINRFLSWKIFAGLDPVSYKRFLELGHYDFVCPDGESTRIMQQTRTVPFISKLGQKFAGKKVFVISHGLFILTAKCEIVGNHKQGFEADFKAKKPRNCSLTTFRTDSSSSHSSGLVLDEFDLVL